MEHLVVDGEEEKDFEQILKERAAKKKIDKMRKMMIGTVPRITEVSEESKADEKIEKPRGEELLMPTFG